MSWDVLYNECQAWELWFLSGNRSKDLWEARRALISEVYHQVIERTITIRQAKQAYRYIRGVN